MSGRLFLTALCVGLLGQYQPTYARSNYTVIRPEKLLWMADSVGLARTSALLTITVRLIDAEADTIISHAKLTAVDEKSGQSIPVMPDSSGFRLSAATGTTISIQASAPDYIAAQTRILNLSVSQRVIIKLMHTKPSVLTIKAFAVNITQPLAVATATITSKITGKTEHLPLKNGRLQRTFTKPDKIEVQVSSPGYATASRQLTIEVQPLGNRYEFDAELDKLKLSVRAVDSRTNEEIVGGHFTLTGLNGVMPIVLVPTPKVGWSTATIPSKGTYQLTCMADGYDIVTQSVNINRDKSELVIRLTAKSLNTALMTARNNIQTQPALLTTSVASVSVVSTKSFGVIERGKSIRLNKIYFDQSSPVLRPESFIELDQLYAVLSDYPSLRIEIRGYTDNQGDFDLNTQLSRDRCRAVAEYLFKKGIRRGRLNTVGRGPLDPVAPNNSEENRKKNRRVEFVLF